MASKMLDFKKMTPALQRAVLTDQFLFYAGTSASTSKRKEDHEDNRQKKKMKTENPEEDYTSSEFMKNFEDAFSQDEEEVSLLSLPSSMIDSKQDELGEESSDISFEEERNSISRFFTPSPNPVKNRQSEEREVSNNSKTQEKELEDEMKLEAGQSKEIKKTLEEGLKEEMKLEAGQTKEIKKTLEEGLKEEMKLEAGQSKKMEESLDDSIIIIDEFNREEERKKKELEIKKKEENMKKEEKEEIIIIKEKLIPLNTRDNIEEKLEREKVAREKLERAMNKIKSYIVHVTDFCVSESNKCS